MSSTRLPRAAGRAAASAVVAALALQACAGRAPACDGPACAAECPRDAARDASGRCACRAGSVAVLGACVPPAVGDSYCGPAARLGADGCVFRQCPADERLDAVTGACLQRAAVSPGAACAGPRKPIIEQGRVVCVEPDAACPRGTRSVGDAGAGCARPPSCPPGSLWSGADCRPVVQRGARGDAPRVDVGGWAALVLGTDGGPGSPELCRSLALRPDVFGVVPAGVATVRAQVTLVVPDQDLTRVYARVQGDVLGDGAGHALSGDAEALLAHAVDTLVEPLRGLGGEASAAILELQVKCKVGGH